MKSWRGWSNTRGPAGLLPVTYFTNEAARLPSPTLFLLKVKKSNKTYLEILLLKEVGVLRFLLCKWWESIRKQVTGNVPTWWALVGIAS